MKWMKINNDQLGLTKIWYTVPPEAVRPQSAIDFDRKSVAPTKKIPDYGNQLGTRIRAAELRRAQKKRARDNEHSA